MNKDKQIIEKQEELINALAQSLSIVNKEVRANDCPIFYESDKRLKMYYDHVDDIVKELSALKAMEGEGVTDEDIRVWAENMEDDLYERSHSVDEVRMIVRNRIFGAKAHKDNLIKKI